MAYDDLVCAPSVPLAIIRHAVWKGCVHLKKGMQVDVVGSDAEGTEIVYERKHLFAEDPLF